MMRLNKIFSFLLLLTVTLSVSAQSAKQILDRTSDMIRGEKGLTAEFTVTAGQMSDRGTLDMFKDKFLLRTDAAITWFDGKTQWTYITDSQEVNISEPSEEELQNINPYYLLTLYKKHYRMKMQPSGAGFYKILLTSASPKNDIESVLLTLRKDNYMPSEMVVKRGAEKAFIKITSFKRGVGFPTDYFVFPKAKYPHAEIIDLR